MITKKINLKCTLIKLIGSMLPIVALVLISGCSPSPTQNPQSQQLPLAKSSSPSTISPSKYVNSQYGFTFNICNDSDFELVENNGSAVVALVGPLLRDFKHDIRISVILFQTPKKISLDDFLTKQQAAAKANLKNFAILNETDTTIAGLPAKISHSSFTIATSDNEINYRTSLAVFMKDNIIYAIQYETDSEIYEDHVQCFNFILSTFKFN